MLYSFLRFIIIVFLVFQVCENLDEGAGSRISVVCLACFIHANIDFGLYSPGYNGSIYIYEGF